MYEVVINKKGDVIPREKSTSLAATATEEPQDEPPGM